MLTLLAAVTIAAAPPPALPRLTDAQMTALRCAVVFARGARMQREGAPAAAEWPDLSTRGREYFVRVTAKLMDETRASREQVAGLAGTVPNLENDAAVAAAMPGCLPLLAAAGL